MRIIFMGTPVFASTILKDLLKEHEILCVVSQPDKPKNRGHQLIPTPVKETAIQNNIKVYQPLSVKEKDFIKEMEEYNADLFVVVAFGQILPTELLYMAKYGSVNVHASLLPKLRGAAPIHFAIINGDEKTGVTIMYMEEGLDTGDMILKKEIAIEEADTLGSLHDKLSVVGSEALLEAIKLIENDNVNISKQDHSISTYAKMITKEMGHINFSNCTKDILNLIRGLNPAPGAYCFLNEEMIKIWEAKAYEFDGKACNGEIVAIVKNEGLVVKTNDTAVLITELQGKSGKKMSASSYLAGHKVEIGTMLI